MDWLGKLKTAEDLGKARSATEQFQLACERLAQTPKGARNQELNKVAFIGGTLVTSGKAQEWWVEQQLMEACEENGYVKDSSEDEARRIVTAGMKAGKAVEPEHDNPIYKMATRTSQLRNLPQPKWLVKGLLQENTTAFVISEPGVGKSFFVLDLAAHIADQEHWHGRPIQKNGTILYITPEGAESMDRRRIAWETYHSKTMSDNIVFFSESIHVGSYLWEQFESYCEDIKPTVIVIDTLARNTGGADENGSAEMKSAVAHLDRLRQKIKCTFIVVHHTTKGTGNLRGHGSLDGAADTIIKLARPDPAVQVQNVWVVKQKNGPEPHMGKWKMEEIEVAPGETSVVMIPMPDIPWDGVQND